MAHLPGSFQHSRSETAVFRQAVHHRGVVRRIEQVRADGNGQQHQRQHPDGYVIGKEPGQKKSAGDQQQRTGPQPARVVAVMHPPAQSWQKQPHKLVGQQHQRRHYRRLPQPVLHQYRYQRSHRQHRQVKSGVGEQGHRKILLLEVSEIHEGIGTALLNYKEQPQASQEQQVHRQVVTQCVRGSKGLRPFVNVQPGQDESPQGNHHQRRPQVVDGYPFHILNGLLPVILQ